MTKATTKIKLLGPSAVYVYPGRGVGEAKSPKLPKAAALFADLAAAWHGDPYALDVAKDLPDFEPPALTRAVAALDAGKAPAQLTAHDAGAVWRALAPVWRAAWGGTPAALTASKRLGEKFALWALASGGAGFAVEALRATWSQGPGAPPASPELDHSFWYLERQFAGFSAVRTLRERLASVPDAEYAKAVAAGRAMWAELPAHLQAAVAFLLPTERDLADAAMTRTERHTGPYQQVACALNLSPVGADCWPPYVAFLVWSLPAEADFARATARRFFGGSYAWAVACATLHPKLLTEYDARELLRKKLAEPA